MTDAHNEAHPTGYKQYFVTWCWLLVMTLLALGIGYAPIPEGLRGFLLVCITLAKIVLIASIFMHLRTEKLNLVMLTFSPLVLALILFFITFGESAGSSTHIIVTHMPK
jgi:caa(3)-type oxidase subunit IV